MKKFFLISILLTSFLIGNLLFAGGRFLLLTAYGKDYYKDSQTNLFWTGECEADKTWQQALIYCEELDYAGFTDWRLPNMNELANLINPNKYKPATDLPHTPSKWFWSSSSYAGPASYAWIVDFYNGNVDDDGKDVDGFVRCVR